jgi:hypothetical protein
MINKHSIKLTLSWIALIVLIVSSISAQTSTGKQNYNKYCLPVMVWRVKEMANYPIFYIPNPEI